MRFLWGYGAVAALTLAVSVGLLDVPSRVLGHADLSSTPITLPAALAAPSAVVVASPPPEPLHRVHHVRPQPQTGVPELAGVVRPAPLPRRPATPATVPQVVTPKPKPTPKAHAPTPKPAPAPTPVPAPAPAPTPTPTPTPAPAPQPEPTPTPTPTPATPAPEPTPSDTGTKPGWGCGDKNHDHSGPPGQDGSSPC